MAPRLKNISAGFQVLKVSVSRPLSMGNGPAGIGPTDIVQPHAMAFPSPIAVAASWNRHDAWLYGASVADEMQAIGRTMLEAPTVNICRIPASGRTFEGYGDPFLSAETAVASIKGIQSLNMLANVKYFALNNQEADRQFVDMIDAGSMLRISQIH
jgi:beta-glucosidase